MSGVVEADDGLDLARDGDRHREAGLHPELLRQLVAHKIVALAEPRQPLGPHARPHAALHALARRERVTLAQLRERGHRLACGRRRAQPVVHHCRPELQPDPRAVRVAAPRQPQLAQPPPAPLREHPHHLGRYRRERRARRRNQFIHPLHGRAIRRDRQLDFQFGRSVHHRFKYRDGVIEHLRLVFNFHADWGRRQCAAQPFKHAIESVST